MTKPLETVRGADRTPDIGANMRLGDRRSSIRRWLCSFVIRHPRFVILLLVPGHAHAAPPEHAAASLVLDAVPRDAVAVYFHPGPDPETPTGDAPDTLALAALLVDAAHEIGLFSKVDSTARTWIDALASASVVLRHPHAIVLLDISARPRGNGGHRLSGLHAALIVAPQPVRESPPPAAPYRQIEQRIQRLLNLYTNHQDTVLTTRTRQGRVADGEAPRFEIQDRRLPPWATITWGPIREFYIVAIGNGAFDRIADTLRDRAGSLALDQWFGPAFEAAGGAEVRPGGGLGWYVRFDRLRAESDPGESGLTGKIDRVLAALRLRGAKRGLWTVRYKAGATHRGRAVEVAGVVRRNDVDTRSVVAADRFISEFAEPVIPRDATGYAIIDCNPRTVLTAFCQAYLAARSPAARQSARSFWRSFQEAAGVSIERDIVSHLGRYVVIHDYPRHALRLPLMWTILMRIDGDPDALRAKVDRLVDYARKELARTTSVQLRRDDDGVWYLQLGISGPALAVTDRWLIIGFSPHAVRQNIAILDPSLAPSVGAAPKGR